jgi:predicted nucleic acid-binding protein
MASTVLADSGFLVALLVDRDSNHDWAVAMAAQHPRPWKTCEAAISETAYLLGPAGTDAIALLLERGLLVCSFDFTAHVGDVMRLMKKYNNVPMSFADACFVRMTEIMPDPVVLTTDSDFQVYRRNGRQVVPCVTPR